MKSKRRTPPAGAFVNQSNAASDPDGRSSDILPFAALTRTLPNGLQVIVVATGLPNLVALQIPVQTGSRNEVEPGKSGFAHFFEHMMFRGTPRFPPEEYEAIITRAGARQNAYTTDDYTNYHITFAREDLETILAIEADRFMNLAYSEEGFKTEARAILGEYNKSSANPMTRLVEAQREAAFDVHPYKHTTMGFLRDVEAMPDQYDYAQTFFRRWYRPEFTTVIVAGDVDPELTAALVERYWGDWQSGGQPVAIPPEPLSRGPRTAHVPWGVQTLPLLSIAFHGPAFSEVEKDYAALDVLLDLQFGETSDLYRRLVQEEQIVDRLFAYVPATADPQLATIIARPGRVEDLPAVRDAILAAVAAAREEAVPALRLEEAKTNARYGFVRALDNSEAIASALARFVRFSRSYDTLNNLFRLYDALTPDDLLAAARHYFSDEGLVITTLAHEPLPEPMALAPSLTSFEEQPADLAELPAVVLRTPSPLVRLKLLFTAGSAHDPAGKEGLASLAAAMIAEGGSRVLRADEVRAALFPLAASFDARTDKEMTVFTGVAHRETLERFADVALPLLLEPGLRESDFDRLRQTQRNALVQDLRTSNEEELAKERLQANLFAGTPYAHPPLGSVAGIDALTPADVQAFIARGFSRANLMLGLAGDVHDEFEARLRRALARLPQGEPHSPGPIAGRMPEAMEIEIIQKETRSTAISFGHPLTVTRADPDFAALWLARAWLGEHRASLGRLYQRLREVRGLNYGDYAYVEAFPRGMYLMSPEANVARRAQLFELWIRPVVPEHAVFALKAALFELRRLIEHGLSAEEFEAIQTYLMKSVYLLTRTQDQQLGYALDSRWYVIGEFTATMRARLQALSAAEVNAAVRRHLSAERLSVVIVDGNAAALAEALLSDTPAAVSYDAPKPPELLAEDREIAGLRLPLSAARLRITPVEAVFAV
jgi:zinc protease